MTAFGVHLYRRAAEQGNTYAQTFLGHMYANGRGVPQDDAEAVRRYRPERRAPPPVAAGSSTKHPHYVQVVSKYLRTKYRASPSLLEITPTPKKPG